MLTEILKNFIGLTGRGYVNFVPLALVILALVLYIRYNLIVIMPISKALKEIIDYIDTVSRNIASCDKAFKNAPRALGSLWKQFKGSLDHGSLNSVGLVYEYFNDRTLSLLTGRKKSEVVPSVLAGLGILTAVFHLAFGLIEIEGAKTASESYFKAFSQYALEAVALMFAAFLVSLIYLILDRLSYNITYKRFNTLRERLSDSVLGMTEKHITEARDEQTETIKHLVEAIGNKFDIVSGEIEELGNTFKKTASDIIGKSSSIGEEALQRMTSSFIEMLHTSSAKYYIKLSDAMIELTDVQLKASGSIKELYSGVEKAVHKQEELNHRMSLVINDLGGFLEQLRNGGEILASGLSELGQVSVLMNSIPGAISESIERLEAERKLLSEDSRRIVESFGDMENGRVDSLNAALENIFNRFSDVTGAVIKEYEENSTRTAEKLSDTVNIMLDGMDQKLYTINLYSSNLSVDIKSLTDTLDSSVEKFKIQMTQSVDTTFQSFDDALSDITQRLGNTVEAMRESVEELPALIAAAKADEDGTKEKEI